MNSALYKCFDWIELKNKQKISEKLPDRKFFTSVSSEDAGRGVDLILFRRFSKCNFKEIKLVTSCIKKI